MRIKSRIHLMTPGGLSLKVFINQEIVKSFKIFLFDLNFWIMEQSAEFYWKIIQTIVDTRRLYSPNDIHDLFGIRDHFFRMRFLTILRIYFRNFQSQIYNNPHHSISMAFAESHLFRFSFFKQSINSVLVNRFFDHSKYEAFI